MGVSPTVAGESPQKLEARLPSYLPGAAGLALDFNLRLGWRREGQASGPEAVGAEIPLVLVPGELPRVWGWEAGADRGSTGHRGACGFICSSVGWQGFTFPCFRFPLYKTGVFPTLDMRPPSPQCPLTAPAREGFTGVWAGLVVTPWASYSLSGKKNAPGKREQIRKPCPLTGQGAWARDWGDRNALLRSEPPL